MVTEAQMLGMLERRYRGETSGNGPAWAFVPHVRNAAGFSATRTVDAIAMSLWPSRGLELHGFEIKCARSDWLRELRKPFTAAGRSFLAALLRSAARTHDVTPEEVQQAIDKAVTADREHRDRRAKHDAETIELLRGRLDAFKSTFGVALGDAEDLHWYGGKPAAEVGAALRLVIDGKADLETYERRLRLLLDNAERLTADLRRSLGEEPVAA